MVDSVPVLIISGSMGAGKTTVMWEISGLLAKARIPHAAIDLDQLSVMYPPQGPFNSDLMFASLKTVWPVHTKAGAERLVVARVVEDRSELVRYADSIPGAEFTICRLKTPVEEMQNRLSIREPGTDRPHALARSAELHDILENARLEDFSVDNGPGRSVPDVASEVLTAAGWL